MGSGNSSSAASSLRIARWPLGSYFLHEHLTKQCCVKGGIFIFCVGNIVLVQGIKLRAKMRGV